MGAVLSMKNELYTRERAYLADVQAYLRREIKTLTDRLQRQKEEDRETKAQAYAEGLEFKEGGGLVDSAQVQDSLRRNFHRQEEMEARLTLLKSLLAQPYFARIDLRMTPDETLRSCYIGLRDLVDERAMTQWVVDWRSPVASLYYEGEIGHNHYETPRGQREVELVDKYQFLIRDGEIEEIYRQSDERYDRMLHEVLSEHASPRLEAIAATLQKEQNAVIRTSPERDLILVGVAGSGKSSVAMHRAAWLLYRNPKLQASDILLISPNRQFTEYIADILPTLQGDPLRSMTFEQLCRDVVSRVEGRYRNYTYPEPTWERANAMGKPEFWRKWTKFLDKFVAESFNPAPVSFARHQVSAEEIAQLWDENTSHLPLYKRAEAVLQLLLERYRHRRILWHRDKVLEQIEAMLPVYNLRELLDLGLAAVGQEPGKQRLDQLDLSLLASLVLVFHGVPSDYDVKHLMVDEMQDLMLWQHAFLAEIFPATKTILGDLHQALTFIAEETYLDDLIRIYGGAERVLHHDFHIAYRSSWEISEFSKRIVGAEEIESLERHVKPVRVVLGDQVDEQLIRDFAAAVEMAEHNSYAILCADMDVVEGLQDLAEQLEGPMLKSTPTFVEGEISTLILTPTMARGMEFDSVWIYSPTIPDPSDQQHQQALYVSATRALHDLSLYAESTIESLYELGIDEDADYWIAEERA